MNKRDVIKLQVDDEITLKHNLGRGKVTKIAWEPEKHLPKRGRYPMIQYEEEGVPGHKVWCTYLIVETVKHILRSV